MENNYKFGLKNELKNLRERKIILENREKKFNPSKNIFLLWNYLSNSELRSKVNSIRDTIYVEKSNIELTYGSLRKDYRNRFNFFEGSELFNKYDKLSGRVIDLEKRYARVNSLKNNSLLFKISCSGKRINGIMNIIDDEKSRRKRACDDVLNEIWSRGICLERFYFQKMFEEGRL
jgi:hypothetical protein